MIGFTTYIDESVKTPPSLGDILAGMTNAEKIAVLDAFQAEQSIVGAKHATRQPTVVIFHLYALFEDVELTCRQVMLDNPPNTVTQLKNAVAPLMVAKYENVFSEAQVGVVVDRVVLCSKKDSGGNYAGTFTTYKNGVQG